MPDHEKSCIRGSADNFRHQSDNRRADTVSEGLVADHFLGDTNMTDAEILLRDWCGQE